MIVHACSLFSVHLTVMLMSRKNHFELMKCAFSIRIHVFFPLENANVYFPALREHQAFFYLFSHDFVWLSPPVRRKGKIKKINKAMSDLQQALIDLSCTQLHWYYSCDPGWQWAVLGSWAKKQKLLSGLVQISINWQKKSTLSCSLARFNQVWINW